ncbi:MAG: membrane protein insertion efficiency factor YidD [Pyramidobacter sp.]|jgi:putative membrane protein insertion efficiency factor
MTGRDLPGISDLGTALCIALIKGYKRCISPMLGHHCRFYPSCSSYAIEALKVHGLPKGLALTLWRLLRCGPWSEGGFDPVPPPKSQKNGKRSSGVKNNNIG